MGKLRMRIFADLYFRNEKSTQAKNASVLSVKNFTLLTVYIISHIIVIYKCV